MGGGGGCGRTGRTASNAGASHDGRKFPPSADIASHHIRRRRATAGQRRDASHQPSDQGGGERNPVRPEVVASGGLSSRAAATVRRWALALALSLLTAAGSRQPAAIGHCRTGSGGSRPRRPFARATSPRAAHLLLRCPAGSSSPLSSAPVLIKSRFSLLACQSSLVTTHHHHRWQQSVSVRQPLPPSFHHAPPDLRLPTPRAACRTTGPIARAPPPSPLQIWRRRTAPHRLADRLLALVASRARPHSHCHDFLPASAAAERGASELRPS